MAEVFSIPMAIGFRGLTQRTGMLIRGEAGWGEWSPFPEYGDAEASVWLKAALEAANQGFPPPVRSSIEVNVTIPACDPETAHRLARESDCRTAKVKVAQTGHTLAEDLARVEAVRDAMGADAKLRVDANGAWSVDEAVQALSQLDRFDLEYAEQPCRTVEELAVLRRKTSIRIAADESIRRAADPLRVKELAAADVVVLKVAPLGGVRACLNLAEDLGMDVVVSSAVETSVGLRAGIALAAALPELTYACGLNTAGLLGGDCARDSLTAIDGRIPVRDVHVEPSLLDRYRAEQDTRSIWETRLLRCQSYLGARSLDE
ncbi:MAG: o-succinylbenzoate synthase [Propionibacteriaceae bacterium]|nr:o-succinylbenzoate synthase [Propionibacteriaceae bacterium]